MLTIANMGYTVLINVYTRISGKPAITALRKVWNS